MKIPQQFHVVRRPEGVISRYAIIVVKSNGLPHRPLTTFYHELHQFVADGTARTYLNTLIPYFSYLATDEWRRHRQDSWESPPEAVRESVRDYLVECLHCKAQPKDTYQLVQLTVKSPSTVRVFLSALKQFYPIVCRLEWHPYPHPLLDSVAHLIQEVEAQERQVAGQRPRMPQRSGVEDPKQPYTSDNYFKLVEDEWQPQPIDDPNLHMLLSLGFKQAGLQLRDQIVIRLAYESGARIRELLGLTVGDWRKRGGKQEAWAASKGSYGRRVKVIRFGKETSRMLHAYVNTERCRSDQSHRRLGALDDAEPLFLSNRGNPYGYDTFKKQWYKLCNVLKIDLNIHALRHWYVTQEIRLICERAKEPGDIVGGKEDLVRYMAWRSLETLQAYEHYFDDLRHAETQSNCTASGMKRINATSKQMGKLLQRLLPSLLHPLFRRRSIIVTRLRANMAGTPCSYLGNRPMPKYHVTREQRLLLAWSRFQEIVHPLLLAAPRLSWDQVDRRLVYYMTMHVTDMPWLNHLAFLVAISACHARLDVRTVKQRLQVLHRGWQTIFSAYRLAGFAGWDPAEHLPRYMSDPALEASLHTRQEFLSTYTASTRSVEMYLRSLPEGERMTYRQWELPLLPAGMREQLARHKDVQEVQAQRRKAESDAVTPHFSRIRAEAHVRWNEINRLRQKFREVVALVESGQAEPPLSFSYEEPRRRQRLHFMLWNRASFVVAHANQYHPGTVAKAQHRRKTFRPERDHFFLEFRGAENLAEVPPSLNPDGLLWFGDLLRYDVLGRNAVFGTPEEVQHKQAYLRSWGYGAEEKHETEVLPFQANHPGLLTGGHIDGTARFLDTAQQRTGGLLFLVEPLFAAATFGLASLDFFTTTGARMTELLQLSLSPDCLYTMQIGGSQRLLVRLVPKGTDKPAEYMVGTETRRNLERVGFMLKEQYEALGSETLPHVPFNPATHREHDFPDPRPYLFQYQGQHLSHKAITACMRFLCHGMVFTSPDGKAIVLKAHLLRRVFATHLHQVEQVPLDIVAKILHQKDVRVTAYYAAPQWQQVVATTDHLLDTFATHLGNIEDAFVRAPAELQRRWEEAKQSVGSLARVIGGECCCHAVCPISFACTGCAYKIPDPSRREEIVQQRQWAVIRYEQVKRQRLGPEAVKMQALIQRCNTELDEMDLMEEYRKDEAYHPELTIKPRGQ